MRRSYQEIAPSPRLRAHVECYWRLEQGQRPQNDCILPDGCVDILFSSRKREPVSLTAVGLMTKPLTCDVGAEQAFFGVRFRPGMAAAFLREAALLNDNSEPLETFWGAPARTILERLAEAAGAQQMAETMERFLRPAEPPDAAQRALRQLAADVPLDRLVSSAGLSGRQFRRACVERAGASPKYLQRILRFRKAVERVRAMAANCAQPSWAQFAAACGYYDQAHFIREFQKFSGRAPGRFLQSLRHLSGIESDHDEPSPGRKSD